MEKLSFIQFIHIVLVISRTPYFFVQERWDIKTETNLSDLALLLPTVDCNYCVQIQMEFQQRGVKRKRVRRKSWRWWRTRRTHFAVQSGFTSFTSPSGEWMRDKNATSPINIIIIKAILLLILLKYSSLNQIFLDKSVWSLLCALYLKNIMPKKTSPADYC